MPNIFLVWLENSNKSEPRKYGGIFSTREKAQRRADFLTANYNSKYIVRELVIDWYDDEAGWGLGPDELY